MTAVICAALMLIGSPCARGGHAEPARDHGGHALAVEQPLVRDLARFDAWICIHRREGSWTDDGDPYWGGLQFDKPFMRAYGSDMLRRHHGGLADTWTPAEQIIVAERAYVSGRGFGPWPNTARDCGYSTRPVAIGG